MDFTRVGINADGNCFFRCVSSFLNKRLLGSDRFKNGKIKDKHLAKLETQACISMRKMVCEKTERHKHKYSKDIYYDDELYKSIEDRIEQMRNPGEFAGLVEIKSAAKILKLCFNIYVPVYSMDTMELNKYNLISKIGSGFDKECHLVLEDNHYELLLPVNDKEHKNEIMNKISTRKIDYGKSDRVLRKKERIKYY
jgi:hypothetical protein